MDKNIALSILNVEDRKVPKFLNNYTESIDKINKLNINSFSYILHFDIMDNKFVPNTGVNIEYIKTAKNLGFYVDTHLMVENPIGDKYIEKAINYGTDDITIHYEIENFESILKYLNDKKINLKKNENRDLVIGVSVKPDTDIKELLKYRNMFSKVLIMSVEPGFGGQGYIESINNKVKEARKLFSECVIQVDGGINFNTIRNLVNLEVDSFVVGSYLTISDSLYNNMLKLEILKDIENLPKDSNTNFDSKLLQIVPGGYGENDILIGITTPNIRKIANKWYKNIDIEVLNEFISSKYHEYRKFACICLSNMMKKAREIKSVDIYSQDKKINVISYYESNLKYINNWDLTDETAPNVLGNYLLDIKENKAKNILLRYIKDENIWIKRIGIVACLSFARRGYKDIPLYICDKVLYDTEPLINKATGWVLREVYKKNKREVIDFLVEHNKANKIPRFVISYATEKMSKEEKEEIKKVNI